MLVSQRVATYILITLTSYNRRYVKYVSHGTILWMVLDSFCLPSYNVSTPQTGVNDTIIQLTNLLNIFSFNYSKLTSPAL